MVVKPFVTATLQAVPGNAAEHMYRGFAADNRQRRPSSLACCCRFGLIVVRLTGWMMHIRWAATKHAIW